MNSWKTTVVSAVAAALSAVAIYQTNGGTLDDWKVWLLPALIAAVGVLAKDFDVTK